jgi:hypothetical protein
MAFRRETLLGLGGFDPQFRQAGDDVDVCWRLLDADLTIGYAAGAMVWHHRRATVRAYARQQKGYGRSEAMVHFKHPQRCGLGRSRWHGIIYGDGAVGLPLLPETIYHGRFGTGLFQTIYRHNRYGMWSILMSLEWHLAAFFLLLLSTQFWKLALVSAGMWCATLGLALRSAWQAPLPKGAPYWCRPLVSLLYVLQPILRGWYRMTHLLGNSRLPCIPQDDTGSCPPVKRISATEHDLYWHSDNYLGRDVLLEVLVNEARRVSWSGDFENAWADWDVKLVGDRWHDILIRTATEELGWPARFTRARCRVRPTLFARVMISTSLIWSAAAVFSFHAWAMALGLAACVGLLFGLRRSRRLCLHTATRLVTQSAELAGLSNSSSRRAQAAFSERGLIRDAGVPLSDSATSKRGFREVAQVRSLLALWLAWLGI